MFKFKRGNEREAIDAGDFGTLYISKVDRMFSWDGLLQIVSNGNKIDVSIETSSEEAPATDRVKSILEFISSYDKLKDSLFTHIYNAYQQSQYSFPFEQTEKMYSLAGVTLKENGDYWVVLEPGDVASVYNHFMRFTIQEGEIVWSNVN